MILYQFYRAKQLQFSCKLNQLLNNSGVKGLIALLNIRLLEKKNFNFNGRFNNFMFYELINMGRP